MFTRGRVNVFLYVTNTTTNSLLQKPLIDFKYKYCITLDNLIQYRYGTTTKIAAQTLWKEGGIRRFYRGIGPALFVS